MSNSPRFERGVFAGIALRLKQRENFSFTLNPAFTFPSHAGCMVPALSSRGV